MGPLGNDLPLKCPLNHPQASPGKELVAVVQTRARRELVVEQRGHQRAFVLELPLLFWKDLVF